MSAQSSACFASCMSVMEVWVGEKVPLGTTDSEPLSEAKGRTNY